MPPYKIIALCGLCLVLGGFLLNCLWLSAVHEFMRELEGRIRRLEKRKEDEP